MIQNNDVLITDFIKFTNTGVNIATYVQIKQAIINRYKLVYGEDIDLSTGTADGVFISDISLIINNILQAFKNTYANLDVNSANGIYLDNLCSLSNVRRKGATHSKASIEVTNTTSSPIVLENLQVVDKSGTTWTQTKGEVITLNSKATTSIWVICDEQGQVVAEAGWIYDTVELSGISIVQPNPAIVGQLEESDSDLRARRAQSSGANGITVLESLTGSLLDISGIRDVKIYNNNTLIDMTAKDGTTIPPHSIYIVIRQQDGVMIDEKLIGSLIYEKLTPGILSTQTKDSNTGISKNYNYIPYSNVVGALSLFNTNVYWKVAKPVKPNIAIKITPLEYFNESEIDILKSKLIEELNKLPLSSNLTTQQILTNLIYADPLFLGRPTFTIDLSSITINGVSTEYKNTDTYYNYSGSEISITV